MYIFLPFFWSVFASCRLSQAQWSVGINIKLFYQAEHFWNSKGRPQSVSPVVSLPKKSGTVQEEIQQIYFGQCFCFIKKKNVTSFLAFKKEQNQKRLRQNKNKSTPLV